MSASRVAIVGARRVRQGLGPFVARDLLAAGAQVPAVLGTSPGSAAAAAAELERELGIRPAAHTDLAALLDDQPVDALAILSPHASHAGYLEQAAARGLHVLCDKPLIWGGERPAERARARIDAFAAAGLLLVENCQWPALLVGYEQLYPGSHTAPPARFRMRLSPEPGDPVSMMVDCLHHPLSCLQQLAPGPAAIEEPRFAALAAATPGLQGLQVHFRYRAPGTGAGVQVQVDLEPSDLRPRPAGLGWDGGWAERSIRVPGYTIYLAAGERAVKVADPLTVHVEAFVRELDAARQGRALTWNHADVRRDIRQRMEALERLVCAYPREGHR